MSERLRAAEAPPADEPGPRILFVADSGGGDPGRPVPERRYGPDIAVTDLAGLTPDLLDGFAPHFVVSPVFAAGFDMMDVARRLAQLGFRGGYRVVLARRLPNPGLILAEVRAACPGLDVDILPAAALGPPGGPAG